MRSDKFTLGLAAMTLVGASFAACSSAPTTPDMATTADMRRSPDLTPAVPKGVYTMSNDVADNQIVVFSRAADGTLTQSNAYSTAGKGSGNALASQGSLIFDSAMNMFFAVNAGDNSVSMLSLKSDGTLTLLFKIPSGGVKPVSVTESGGYLYVVNAGDNFSAGNIAGFQVMGSMLAAIPNSIKPLSSTATGANPAQIQLAPGGANLVVTEKTTNKIDTYPISGGVPGNPMVQNAAGTTPYGFAINANQKVIVSEASTGQPNQGTVSSYNLAANGALNPVSSKIPSQQTAPCWVVLSGTTAFVSNAGSNTISGYTVAADGALTLQGNGTSATTGMGPADEALTEANDYLYVLNSGSHSLSIYAVGANGALTKKPNDFSGLPVNAAGLVAR